MRNPFVTLFRGLIILAALAGLAWGFSAQDPFIFAAVFFVALVLFLFTFVKFKKPEDTEASAQPLIDDAISTLGEPDRIIVVNPMRGAETDGAVLLYISKDILLYNGLQIDRKSVRDMTVNNAAVAFTPEAYQISLVTDARTYHIFTGNDLGWAREVLAQLQDALVAE